MATQGNVLPSTEFNCSEKGSKFFYILFPLPLANISISCCGTDGISALVTARNPVARTQHDLCSFCCSCFLSESLAFVKLVIGFRYSIPDIEGLENRVQGRQKPPFLLGENVSQLYCSSQLRWKKRLLSCSLSVFFSNLGEKTNSFRIPGLKWFCRSTSLLFSSKRRGSTSVLKNPSSGGSRERRERRAPVPRAVYVYTSWTTS